jgi:hypothetical protein
VDWIGLGTRERETSRHVRVVGRRETRVGGVEGARALRVGESLNGRERRSKIQVARVREVQVQVQVRWWERTR